MSEELTGYRERKSLASSDLPDTPHASANSEGPSPHPGSNEASTRTGWIPHCCRSTAVRLEQDEIEVSTMRQAFGQREQIFFSFVLRQSCRLCEAQELLFEAVRKP